MVYKYIFGKYILYFLSLNDKSTNLGDKSTIKIEIVTKIHLLYFSIYNLGDKSTNLGDNCTELGDKST